jgi:CubicO group peptidase (beta-lactamase class C family)
MGASMKRVIYAWTCVAALVATTAVCAQSLVPVKPEDVGLSAQRLAKIGQVFRGEIDNGNLPGAVVMIARKGKLAYAESFGFQDKDKATLMAKDAIFRAYSMTKPFVAVGAMILVEDGRVQLTDPVSKYLPEFQNLQVSIPKQDALGQPTYGLTPADHQPTIQDLLRHTAGLAYGEITGNKLVKDAYAKAGLYKPDFSFNTTDLTAQEEVERLAKAPLAYQPGTVWEYSLATDLLGRVVETASGKRLGEFLEERLFTPLNMPDTAFYVPQNKLGRVAEPLAKDPATGNPNRLIDVSQQPKNDSGGAGSVTTASDYLRFGQMLLDGGKLDDVRIVSRTTVALMTSDQLGERIKPIIEPSELLMGLHGYTFGLGFMVRLQPGIAAVPGSQGEFMWAGYAGTFFWVDPKEQLVVVMMAQAPGPSRAYYRREIKQLVYQAIVD